MLICIHTGQNTIFRIIHNSNGHSNFILLEIPNSKVLKIALFQMIKKKQINTCRSWGEWKKKSAFAFKCNQPSLANVSFFLFFLLNVLISQLSAHKLISPWTNILTGPTSKKPMLPFGQSIPEYEYC